MNATGTVGVDAAVAHIGGVATHGAVEIIVGG